MTTAYSCTYAILHGHHANTCYLQNTDMHALSLSLYIYIYIYTDGLQDHLKWSLPMHADMQTCMDMYYIEMLSAGLLSVHADMQLHMHDI